MGSEPLLRKRTEEEREAYFIEKLAELVTARREAAALKDQLDQAAEEIRLIKEQRDGALELAEKETAALKDAIRRALVEMNKGILREFEQTDADGEPLGCRACWLLAEEYLIDALAKPEKPASGAA